MITWNRKPRIEINRVIQWPGIQIGISLIPAVPTISQSSGKAVVVTAGTPVAFASVRTPAAYLLICADTANSGVVYVGGPEVCNAVAGDKTYIGCPLYPGQWTLFREVNGCPYIDLRYIYLDADTDNDCVNFTYYVL